MIIPYVSPSGYNFRFLWLRKKRWHYITSVDCDGGWKSPPSPHKLQCWYFRHDAILCCFLWGSKGLCCRGGKIHHAVYSWSKRFWLCAQNMSSVQSSSCFQPNKNCHCKISIRNSPLRSSGHFITKSQRHCPAHTTWRVLLSNGISGTQASVVKCRWGLHFMNLSFGGMLDEQLLIHKSVHLTIINERTAYRGILDKMGLE